ncbi:Chromo-like domain superfamily [Sesbania bispinosa]|nr:Chromo-like domain superfamily [Sesbania bispinosa]
MTYAAISVVQCQNLEEWVDEVQADPKLKGTTIPSAVEEVNKLTEERDVMLHDLKANLVKAQDQMKRFADKHRRDIHFEEGDWVYLKLQPYRLRSLAKKVNEKLSPRFYGPYRVVKRVGQVAYLQLPCESRIHPVFHVSLLKKAIGPNITPRPLPPMLSENLELQVEPVGVLAARNNHSGTVEVLLQWKDLPAFEATW